MTRANIKLGAPQLIMPKTLCKSYKIEIFDGKSWQCIAHTDENKSRYCHINVGKKVCKIKLLPTSTWGNSDEVNIFSFDFC